MAGPDEYLTEARCCQSSSADLPPWSHSSEPRIEVVCRRAALGGGLFSVRSTTEPEFGASCFCAFRQLNSEIPLPICSVAAFP
jgi:hypothetical protein